jgi:hypothetical protein
MKKQHALARRAIDLYAAHHLVFGAPRTVGGVAFGAEGFDHRRPAVFADHGFPGRLRCLADGGHGAFGAQVFRKCTA